MIDSGVNVHHAHIAGIGGGVSFAAEHPADGGDFTDRLGHGTAVMAAIQEKAPDAEYHAVKIFDASLRTTTEYLLNAITWAIERRVRVINLSLGTYWADLTNQFEKVVERAGAHGTILVAAREAGGKACLPGCLPGVLGVDLDWECPRNRYRFERSGGEIRFHASGHPRPLPGRPPARNLNGISFAVANMSGFVIRACEGEPQVSLATLRQELMRAVQ